LSVLCAIPAVRESSAKLSKLARLRAQLARVTMERNFTPEAPNQGWTSDITYIATDEGWLYLTGVIDLFSRQVVGWSMRDNMQTNAVTDALRMAWFRRHPEPGLIFHSDRGSQYCSHEFQGVLKDYEMKSSMSRKGNCWADLGVFPQRAH
jgi:putative transposase